MVRHMPTRTVYVVLASPMMQPRDSQAMLKHGQPAPMQRHILSWRTHVSDIESGQRH